MKLFNIIFFIAVNLINAQNKRFYYDYTFANDSTNLDFKTNEMLVLDVFHNKSIFYSNKINQIDSLNLNKKNNVNSIIDPYKELAFREVVVNMQSGNSQLYYMGGRNQNYYEIDSDIKINWTILPEIKTYENYKIQKATAKINNRIWNVWFTKDIPLNNGPYIFKGLPGLIVIAEDNINSHLFRLVGISNIKNVDSYNNIPLFQSKKYISYSKVKINIIEFKKLLKNHDEEFVNNIIPSAPNGSDVVNSIFYDSIGNQISEADYIKNQRENRKKILQKNNNKLINDFKR